MNYRLQNADKTSGFTINTHQKCLKFDDKTPKNVLDFQGKNKRCDLPRKAFGLLVMMKYCCFEPLQRFASHSRKIHRI